MTSPPVAAALLAAETLLAAGNLGAASRRADRVDNSTEALVWLGIAGGMIAVVCLVICVVSRLYRRLRYHSRGSLFRGLCRMHGLDHRARRLLKQVARDQKLAQPARLFTEPKWLNPANLRGPLRCRALEVAMLRNRVFA
jgi:hypothetical protein